MKGRWGFCSQDHGIKMGILGSQPHPRCPHSSCFSSLSQQDVLPETHSSYQETFLNLQMSLDWFIMIISPSEFCLVNKPPTALTWLHRTKIPGSFQTLSFPFPGSPVGPCWAPVPAGIHFSFQEALGSQHTPTGRFVPNLKCKELRVCISALELGMCVVDLYGKGDPNFSFSRRKSFPAWNKNGIMIPLFRHTLEMEWMELTGMIWDSRNNLSSGD